jgi:hypothetical protein
MNSVLRLQGGGGGKQGGEGKKDRQNSSPQECFRLICSHGSGSLFFRTGSSRETIPFVPDGLGIPYL